MPRYPWPQATSRATAASSIEQLTSHYCRGMKFGSWIGQYLLAAGIFCVLDLVWLSLVANDLYRRLLGDLLANEPNAGAAVLFYAIFIGGLVYLVIHPAIEEGSIRRASLNGAIFGLVAYATWDLTNLAVVEGFPVALVPIDMAWGTFLAAAVSTGTYLLWKQLT